MKGLQKIALALVFIGALNWGLIGIFSFDLVAFLFGTLTMLSRAVYIIVIIAGSYSLSLFVTIKEEHVGEHEEIAHKTV